MEVRKAEGETKEQGEHRLLLLFSQEACLFYLYFVAKARQEVIANHKGTRVYDLSQKSNTHRERSCNLHTLLAGRQAPVFTFPSKASFFSTTNGYIC